MARLLDRKLLVYTLKPGDTLAFAQGGTRARVRVKVVVAKSVTVRRIKKQIDNAIPIAQ